MGRTEDSGVITFTESQFNDLKKFIQSYLKVMALGAIREISENTIERNAWLLNEAGFSQREIAYILHSNKTMIYSILARKPVKKKD